MTSVGTKVLMVDDDASYQRLCSRWLARDPGTDYKLATCETGHQALEMCQNQAFCCLLVDYRLPDMTGTEFVKALRALLGDNTPGIIIMTADGGEDAATQAVRVDAADFLSKNDASAQGLRRSVANTINTERLRIDMRARQHELAVAHADLQLKQVQLKKTNDELLRRTAEIQSFYHTLSHEMKTPLTAAREFVSIVKDQVVGELNSEQRQMLEMSLSCCDQMTRHFNDLLDLTRMETGKFKIDIAPINVNDMLMRSLAMITIAATDKNIRIDARGLDTPPNVMMDEGRIAQVVDNLLNNALKFIDDGGRIRLSVGRTSRNTVYFRVLDTGPGIATANLHKIFDRLYQINRGSSTPDDNGLGLGLSISREIVKQHGHQLKAVSRVGVGSCFSFELDVANCLELAA